VQSLELNALTLPHLPFAVYQGEDVTLLRTGKGCLSAAMAVSAWLAQALGQLQPLGGGGLQAPPLLVANFGIAGAQSRDWPIGETVVIHRVRDGHEGESHYPERLVTWSGQETECHTVSQVQLQTAEHWSSRPVFDMEAFGVAEAVTRYLSSSHLVIGKCVSDHLGEQMAAWRSLAARCEEPYREGAARFLQHARRHLRLLAGDSRREHAQRMAEALESLLEQARNALSLTVTQQRELSQAWRARLAAACDETALQQEVERWRQRLSAAELGGQAGSEGRPPGSALGKSDSKKALAALLGELNRAL
jgi:hypothetical protein